MERPSLDELDKVVLIDYTNYRGERSYRRIIPILNSLRHDTAEHHEIKQWLIDAFCIERQAVRTFAVLNIHSWQMVTPRLTRQEFVQEVRRRGYAFISHDTKLEGRSSLVHAEVVAETGEKIEVTAKSLEDALFWIPDVNGRIADDRNRTERT